MKRWIKIILGVLLLVIIAAGLGYASNLKGWFAPGNAEEYSVASTESVSNSPLKGQKIIFLGSSVTYGFSARGESFVDYLVKKDGVKAVKEAVSGTTLVDEKDSSYVSRMKTIDKNFDADAFVCQLSTNDATYGKPLGTVSTSFDRNDYDTTTVAGAIEYIISYASETWGCPVIFYTDVQYDSDEYGGMVDLLYTIQKKWDIEILDLWNDPDMNAVSDEEHDLYMANDIHPARAGYREWWLPKFEEILSDVLLEENSIQEAA